MSEITTKALGAKPTLAGAGDGGAFGRAVGLWPGIWTLWQREMVRFFRQKNRVVSALVTPVLLWIGLGAGLDRAFVQAVPVAMGTDTATAIAADSARGVGYMAYFFPGTLTMILLFAAIFSTISVIEDRKEGFMQGVLVAPVPRLSIVLGKVFGGASIALIQAFLFLLIWPFIGPGMSVMTWIGAALVLVLLAVSMTALGLCIAWPMDSTAAFHAVMMLFLMPMWFLCGAIFPVSTAMPWLRVLMWLNPLTYGQAVLSRVLLHQDVTRTGLPMMVEVLLMLLFAAGTLALAVRIVGTPRKDGA